MTLDDYMILIDLDAPPQSSIVNRQSPIVPTLANMDTYANVVEHFDDADASQSLYLYDVDSAELDSEHFDEINRGDHDGPDAELPTATVERALGVPSVSSLLATPLPLDSEEASEADQ